MAMGRIPRQLHMYIEDLLHEISERDAKILRLRIENEVIERFGGSNGIRILAQHAHQRRSSKP